MSEDQPSRLSRRLGVADAVFIGLGSMIGAGVFAALAPAAAAAGSALLVGLVIAGAVAACNATSSARLAARYPQSGGTYVYGRERLGPFWGHLAGWGFVVGKTASCAAMSLTFGLYAAPEYARVLAIAAVVGLTTVNYHGVRRTSTTTKVLVVIVLATLATVVVAGVDGPVDGAWSVQTQGAALGGVADLPAGGDGPGGLLEAAGLLFFAFAGYARIATVGEEVREPSRNIPRAIAIALAITLAVYGVVAYVALQALGPDRLARSPAPLVTVVEIAGYLWAVPVVKVGAALASLSVLLSLLAGVSRTTFAMSDAGDLPRGLAAVHQVHRVPYRAEVAIGVLVVAAVLVVDLRGALGFSSFCVLAYYGVANASAWTLGGAWPARAAAALGLGGCLLLAFSLPLASVLAGCTVLALGAAGRFLARRFGSRGD